MARAAALKDRGSTKRESRHRQPSRTQRVAKSSEFSVATLLRFETRPVFIFVHFEKGGRGESRCSGESKRRRREDDSHEGVVGLLRTSRLSNISHR